MNSQAMSDGTCGAIKSSDWNSPNDTIARLNGSSCPLDRIPECPFKCKSYYVSMLVESIKKLIEEMYYDNLIDLETMECQLTQLKTERTAEIFAELLEHIKNLKGE